MKRDRKFSGHGLGVPDEKQASPLAQPEEPSAFEEKRLRARRRILKAGVGGVTAAILSVYQRRSEAAHTHGGGDGKTQVMSVECAAKGGQKVGVSLCTSLMNN